MIFSSVNGKYNIIIDFAAYLSRSKYRKLYEFTMNLDEENKNRLVANVNELREHYNNAKEPLVVVSFEKFDVSEKNGCRYNCCMRVALLQMEDKKPVLGFQFVCFGRIYPVYILERYVYTLRSKMRFHGIMLTSFAMITKPYVYRFLDNLANVYPGNNYIYNNFRRYLDMEEASVKYRTGKKLESIYDNKQLTQGRVEYIYKSAFAGLERYHEVDKINWDYVATDQRILTFGFTKKEDHNNENNSEQQNYEIKQEEKTNVP